MTDPADRYLPCTRCAMATEYATMSALGARCRPCYEAFCRDLPEFDPGHVPQGRRPEWQARKEPAAQAPIAVSPPPPPPPPSGPNASAFAAAPRPTPQPTQADDDVPAWATEAAT